MFSCIRPRNVYLILVCVVGLFIFNFLLHGTSTRSASVKHNLYNLRRNGDLAFIYADDQVIEDHAVRTPGRMCDCAQSKCIPFSCSLHGEALSGCHLVNDTTIFVPLRPIEHAFEVTISHYQLCLSYNYPFFLNQHCAVFVRRFAPSAYIIGANSAT